MQLKQGLKIFAVPLFSDNYSYIVKCSLNSALLLIDPANPEVIINCLDKYFNNLTVSHILYTHKHWDHAGGAKQLYNSLYLKNQKLQVYAGLQDSEQIGTVTHPIKQDKLIKFTNQGLTIQTYKVPCHTRGHTLYHFTNISQNTNDEKQILEEMTTMQGKKIWMFNCDQCCFTGDTLFSGGVGKFFQGNAQQMYQNLIKINKNLPPECPIFNGHEYTLSNLKWGALAQPENKYIAEQLQRVENQEQPICTIPSSLQKQRLINLFLRSASQSNNRFKMPGAQYLHVLREAKNAGSSNLQEYMGKL